MLRTLTLAAGLLAASGTAFAYDHAGHQNSRVISVEPNIVVSFGNRHHDGYRIVYETGRHHHWTHSNTHTGNYYVRIPGYASVIQHPSHHDRDGRPTYHDWRHDHHHDPHDDHCTHRHPDHDD